jgi:hypothetical protein
MSQETPAYDRHAETTILVAATPSTLFEFLDDHNNLSSHMENSSSPMMGGGRMELLLDDADGRTVGSHIVMRGSAFGLNVFVDEIVVERTPPVSKSWRTVEERLVVIGRYSLGFTISGKGNASRLTVWIDYDLPARGRVLGLLGGGAYAKWCVKQMTKSALAKYGPGDGGT